VIIGCTEITLLIGPGDTDVPLLDSTRLHAERAVKSALAAAASWRVLATDGGGTGSRAIIGCIRPREERMKPVNDIVFFAVELVTLLVVGVWGWHVAEGPWRFVLAAALPILVAVAWARFAAPNSRTQLNDPSLMVFQLVVFLLGAAALAATGRVGFGVALGVIAVAVVVLNRVLA
jgi:hypothetical protein